MNKEQIQRLLDISKEHNIEIPEEILKEWERLTPQELSDIIEAVLQQTNDIEIE